MNSSRPAQAEKFNPFKLNSGHAWLTVFAMAFFLVALPGNPNIGRVAALVTAIISGAQLLNRERQHSQHSQHSQSSAGRHDSMPVPRVDPLLSELGRDFYPLVQALVGTADLLKEHEVTDQTRALIDRLRADTELLQCRADDLLEVAGGGDRQLAAADFRLRTELKRTLLAVQPRALDKRLPLRLHLAPDLPDALHGDRRRLRRLLLGLLSTTIADTHSGEVAIAAEQTTLDGRRYLLIEVTADGLGMSALRQPSFIMGGRLASKMDGELTVEEGIARLRLPLVEAGDGKPADTPTVIAEVAPGPRVLVVDADANTRLMLSSHLVALGCQAETMATSDTLLKEWQQAPFDALLVDGQHHPQTEAYLRSLRQLPGGAQLKIVALVSDPGADHSWLRALSVRDTLAKPIEKVDLAGALVDLLGAGD